jgi:membrane protein insertase Oxa1/YidC/SpoIIIJ
VEVPVITDVYHAVVDALLVDLPVLPWFEGVAAAALQALRDLGLPWAAAILLLTFTARALLLPIGMRARRSSFVLVSLRPYMAEERRTFADDREAVDDRLYRLFKDNRVSLLAQSLAAVVQFLVFASIARVLLSESFAPAGAAGMSLGPLLPDIRSAIGASGVGGWLVLALYVPLQTAVAFHTAVVLTRRQRAVMLVGSFLFLPLLVNVPITVVLAGMAGMAAMVLEHALMSRRMRGATLALPRASDDAPIHTVPLVWGVVHRTVHAPDSETPTSTGQSDGTLVEPRAA